MSTPHTRSRPRCQRRESSRGERGSCDSRTELGLVGVGHDVVDDGTVAVHEHDRVVVHVVVCRCDGEGDIQQSEGACVRTARSPDDGPCLTRLTMSLSRARTTGSSVALYMA